VALQGKFSCVLVENGTLAEGEVCVPPGLEKERSKGKEVCVET